MPTHIFLLLLLALLLLGSISDRYVALVDSLVTLGLLLLLLLLGLLLGVLVLNLIMIAFVHKQIVRIK